MIRWTEHSDTGFHDHDESAAAITVISGHVREDRLTIGGGSPPRLSQPFEVQLRGEPALVRAHVRR